MDITYSKQAISVGNQKYGSNKLWLAGISGQDCRFIIVSSPTKHTLKTTTKESHYKPKQGHGMEYLKYDISTKPNKRSRETSRTARTNYM